jgi:hypothetical protein
MAQPLHFGGLGSAGPRKPAPMGVNAGLLGQYRPVPRRRATDAGHFGMAGEGLSVATIRKTYRHLMPRTFDSLLDASQQFGRS